MTRDLLLRPLPDVEGFAAFVGQLIQASRLDVWIDTLPDLHVQSHPVVPGASSVPAIRTSRRAEANGVSWPGRRRWQVQRGDAFDDV